LLLGQHQIQPPRHERVDFGEMTRVVRGMDHFPFGGQPLQDRRLRLRARVATTSSGARSSA
jgi:hypothetical protein